MKKIQLNHNSKGFTLIEMAIVMVIGGILLSFMGSALLTYMKKGRVDKTEYRMEAIKEALNQYLNINRRYPCPSRQDIAPGEDDGGKKFGIEIDSDCSTPFATGNTIVGGDIRIGSVPTRTLNLPDEFSLDGWGNRFTYAVTIDSASTTGGPGGTTFTNSGGLIEIVDSTGNVFLPSSPPASPADPGAHYVLVSHGFSGEGAYTLGGNLMQNCTTGALDNENCNDDEKFMQTLVNSGADTADFYDDYMYYQGQTLPDFEIFPTGAVIPFNSAGCPPGGGWSEFTDVRGRFIIGAGTGTIDYKALMADRATGDLPVNADGADIPSTIDYGTITTETDSNGLPPYIALTYCVKN